MSIKQVIQVVTAPEEGQVISTRECISTLPRCQYHLEILTPDSLNMGGFLQVCTAVRIRVINYLLDGMSGALGSFNQRMDISMSSSCLLTLSRCQHGHVILHKIALLCEGLAPRLCNQAYEFHKNWQQCDCPAILQVTRISFFVYRVYAGRLHIIWEYSLHYAVIKDLREWLSNDINQSINTFSTTLHKYLVNFQISYYLHVLWYLLL